MTSEMPEDILDKAITLWNEAARRDDPHVVIAQALLAERNAQKYRDAQIAAGFDDGDPYSDFSDAARMIESAIRQQATP